MKKIFSNNKIMQRYKLQHVLLSRRKHCIKERKWKKYIYFLKIHILNGICTPWYWTL